MMATMTTLRDDFVFSQSNLQTYSDCPRRFWLSYVQRLPWPAVEASPIQEAEYVIRLGEAFHRALQRAEAGIEPELVAAQLEDPLDTWFASYRQYRPRDLPIDEVKVESVLTTSLNAGIEGTTIRLSAKYDLLAIESRQRAVIIDWKTTRRRTEPTHLRQRLQSQVYPFVVVEASANLPWGPLSPEQVEMRYWFTVAPDEPVTLRYNAEQHEANRNLLQRMIGQILTGEREEDFPKLPDTEANRARVCAYCAYRSRCDRGVLPGDLNDLADSDEIMPELDADLEIVLNEIPELAF